VDDAWADVLRFWGKDIYELPGAEATMLIERIIDNAPVGPDGWRQCSLVSATKSYKSPQKTDAAKADDKDLMRPGQVAAHGELVDGEITEVEV
jgi:hypothetical protein